MAQQSGLNAGPVGPLYEQCCATGPVRYRPAAVEIANRFTTAAVQALLRPLNEEVKHLRQMSLSHRSWAEEWVADTVPRSAFVEVQSELSAARARIAELEGRVAERDASFHRATRNRT